MNSVIEIKPSTAPVVAALRTPTDLGNDARSEIALGLTAVLADTFTLLLKSKNFHWHVSGPHFRDYHLLLDDQADQILAMTDPIAERAPKLGCTTLRSIGHIVSVRRLEDNEKDFVGAVDMLNELRADNQAMVKLMRQLHDLCDEKEDVATASLIEEWIDQAEQRIWFLFEAART
jgi:starvation-inducible DNA-binding protein